MTATFLAKMLTNDTIIALKDYRTKRLTIWEGRAEELLNLEKVDNDTLKPVKDWDFSRKHIIYI